MGTETEYHWDSDADGIVTITFDASGQSANTMNARWGQAMDEILGRLIAEDGLTGVVLASAKKTFFAGGDLEELLAAEGTPEEMFAWTERAKSHYRALEKLPVPVVGAINGAALGGGYEMALACNHRIIIDDPKAVTGLPEVTLGLLPGAGGVVRLPCVIGLEKALPILLEGKPQKPAQALKLGMVDEIVASGDDLVVAAKAWIKTNPEAHTQPWDQKGFRYPGGSATAPNVRQTATMAPTMLYQRTRGLMPAPEKILDVAVNSMRMGFDSALRAETRAFVSLLLGSHAKAAISTFFFGMQSIKSGQHRPAGDRWRAGSSAILGAGMMGAGIAWAHASKGLATTLKDTDLTRAEKGKAYSAGLADKAISRKRVTPEGKDSLLAQIVPTDAETIDNADIIIEAVFEDIDLKEKVIAETFPRLAPGGIYGSNTSTLPISILAEACPEPERFIGLHFFSPVDRMRIVEIILGEKTSDDTLRKAYDYVQQIGYTPIVVNDRRGFFTSRVFGTYLDEGHALMIDGMAPVSIERAAWLAGMPVGPFAVHDEVSMVLSKKVRETHAALDNRLGIENGFPAEGKHAEEVVNAMVEMGRGGRHYGGGLYDYHADGSKTLWPGLERFKRGNATSSVDDAKDRLLYRQAIEALRCLAEGVLRTEVEGNIGSILAIGFPAWTGGALQFCRFHGLDTFKARADALAETYGERFRVTDAMMDALRGTEKAAA
ncbi:MAG: 3-hydroxyacyl-CoA dehydrogenase NAD-binding domain-containing protein [Paracoccaceae bacterium]